MKSLALAKLGLAILIGGAVPALARVESRPESRPNILWITVEDMSPDLGCYGDPFATTPNLDRFAEKAVRYRRAFATAPVCSPARSCLITGCYATSLGTQRLRSHFPVPESISGFPALLRRTGYFTSNNEKTDYNLADEKAFIAACWNRNGSKAHWRQRGEGQPFFSVFNLMTTHQSRTSVWPYEQFEAEVASRLEPSDRHDPARVPLPPYYPDTPLARRAMARYYDCISVMDQQVGEILGQLEEDGLMEDTIIFFYSDHGMGMPRGKRLLHDSGMHVPLLVYFPEKFRDLAPAGAGESVGRLVSFVDFAPTVLSLAGVPIPEIMQGVAFLGDQSGKPREFVFGARDRVDEVFDLSRSARDERFLYIRNYMPHLSWMPPERYSDQSPMRRELKKLAREGALGPAAMTYANPTRPLEELYDTESDPHQIHNLAADPAYRDRLKQMRNVLRRWFFGTQDTGFLMEPEMWSRLNGRTPWEIAKHRSDYPLAALLKAADRVGRESVLHPATAGLRAEEPGVRYWSAVALHAADRLNPAARAALVRALEDPSPSPRIEAAAALLAHGNSPLALDVLRRELQGESVEAVLHAMRTLELWGMADKRLQPAIEAVRLRAQEQEPTHPVWMFVRFSAEAALENLADSPHPQAKPR